MFNLFFSTLVTVGAVSIGANQTPAGNGGGSEYQADEPRTLYTNPLFLKKASYTKLIDQLIDPPHTLTAATVGRCVLEYAAWGVYCVWRYEYTSAWSWLISAAADFAYAFGFVNMTPQIFVNYKLKSVAHMPWRVMVYKVFFIDDVFAFVLMADHMSSKHKLMTLRDDVVFLAFLFQLWCYPLDKTRPDEFGFVYEQPAAVDDKVAAEQSVGERG